MMSVEHRRSPPDLRRPPAPVDLPQLEGAPIEALANLRAEDIAALHRVGVRTIAQLEDPALAAQVAAAGVETGTTSSLLELLQGAAPEEVELRSPGLPSEAKTALREAEFDPVEVAFVRRCYTDRLPPPGSPMDTTHVDPHRAAAFFAALGPEKAEHLVENLPALVGGLDGAPPALRYRANRHLMADAQVELASKMRSLGAERRTLIRRNQRLDGKLTPFIDALGARIVKLADRYKQIQAFKSEDRNFLLFDRANDGRLAEVFGDLTTAANVAVVLPGILNTMDKYRPGRLIHDGPRNIFAAAKSNTATVAWLGYDTPELYNAAMEKRAVRSQPKLIAAATGFRACNPSCHLTLLPHSYGTVLLGTTLRDHEDCGDLADHYVVMGSPGMGVRQDGDSPPVDQLHVDRRRLLAVVTEDDIVRLAPFYGRSPANPAFGLPPENVLSAGRDDAAAGGHSDYLVPTTGSFRNIMAVVENRLDDTVPRRDAAA